MASPTPETITSTAGCMHCGQPRADDSALCPACLTRRRRAAQGPAHRRGDPVGHFMLEAALGTGGMGEVWTATHMREGRLRAAVKFIHGHANPERFVAERRCLASLAHPHIARIYDVGTTPDGEPYLCMEHVEGGLPLTAWCDENRLPVRERLQLFLQVCSAVQHAHQKGIVHRDLKPDNILVSATDDGAVARVIDFGIAKRLESAEPDVVESESLAPSDGTVAGAFVGTWYYASPEQLRGAEVDTRSDVYSLGAVLYELLAGFRPVTDEEFSQLRSMAEGAGGPDGTGSWRDRLALALADHRPSGLAARLREATSTDDPARLEKFRAIAATRRLSLSRLSRAVPVDLEAVVRKAMASCPGERYATPEALGGDIIRWLEHRPVTAIPPSARYTVRQFLRRYPWQTAAAAALLLSIGSGTAAALHYAAQEREALGEAESQRTEARHAQETAEGLINAMLHDLRDKLEPLGRVDLLDDISLQAEKYYEAQDRRGMTSGSVRNRASMWKNRSDVLRAKGSLADSRAALDRSLAIHEEQVREPGSPPSARGNLAGALESLAGLAQTQGRLPEARAAAERAVAIFASLAKEEPQESKWRNNRAAALLQLADVEQKEGHLTAAENAAVQARDLFEALAAARPEDAGALSNLAGAHSRLLDLQLETGSLETARQSAARARDLYEKAITADPENRCWQGNLGMILQREADVLETSGDLPAARASLEKALELANTLAEQDPQNTERQEDVAVCHQRLGSLAELEKNGAAARAHYSASLAISESLLRLDPKNTRRQGQLAVISVKRANLAEQDGDSKTARTEYERARDILDKLATADPGKTRWQFNLGGVLHTLGTLDRKENRPAEAAAAFARCRDIALRLVAATPDAPDACMLLGYAAIGHAITLGQNNIPPADVRAILEEARAPLASLKEAGHLPGMNAIVLKELDEALAALP